MNTINQWQAIYTKNQQRSVKSIPIIYTQGASQMGVFLSIKTPSYKR